MTTPGSVSGLEQDKLMQREFLSTPLRPQAHFFSIGLSPSGTVWLYSSALKSLPVRSGTRQVNTRHRLGVQYPPLMGVTNSISFSGFLTERALGRTALRDCPGLSPLA